MRPLVVRLFPLYVAALMLLGMPAATASPRAPVIHALSVLHQWDAARAHAWAAGDPVSLQRLYVSGSATGRADARLLGRYAGRGLRVAGLTTQIFSVRVLRDSSTLVRMRIVDRVARGVVLGHGQCLPLPADRAGVRTIELRRVAGRWLVALTFEVGR